jgi:hypothetical protein
MKAPTVRTAPHDHVLMHVEFFNKIATADEASPASLANRSIIDDMPQEAPGEIN